MQSQSEQVRSKAKWNQGLLILGIAVIVCGVAYKFPTPMEAILNQKIGESELTKISVLEFHPSPYFDPHMYEATNPQDIEAVMGYLNKITMRRVLFPPKVVMSRETDYIVTLAARKQIWVILLSEDYVNLDGIIYSVHRPKGFQDFSEIIADFPKQ